MTETNLSTDPRFDVGHDIVEGQVYADDRTGDEYRVLYEDSGVVLLRYEDDGEYHLIERRDHFEDNVASGRFSLTEASDASPRMPDDYESVRALASRLRDHYASLGTRTGDHKATAMVEFVDELTSMDDAANVDFEAIDGIGAGAASNLRDAGIVTERDVRRAGRDQLLSIPLMGESNTDALLDEIDE